MNKKSSKTSPENKIPPAYTLTKKKKVTTDEDSSEDSRNEVIKYADSPDTSRQNLPKAVKMIVQYHFKLKNIMLSYTTVDGILVVFSK